MPWVKLDDQWMDHPKIIRAGRDARDMWLASITWCAKHLTDGVFPAALIPTLAVMAGVDVAKCQDFASLLLEVCLWDFDGNEYRVHDYLDYQPTRESSKNKQTARKEAGKSGGLAKASKTLANAKQNAKQNPSKSLPRTRTPIKSSKDDGADAPSENHAVRKELQRQFLILTGLPTPKYTNDSQVKECQKLWWTPLDDIASMVGSDVDIGRGLIEKAVKRMRSDNLTIANPNSILKTVQAIYGEQNTGAGGNFQPSEVYR